MTVSAITFFDINTCFSYKTDEIIFLVCVKYLIVTVSEKFYLDIIFRTY